MYKYEDFCSQTPFHSFDSNQTGQQLKNQKVLTFLISIQQLLKNLQIIQRTVRTRATIGNIPLTTRKQRRLQLLSTFKTIVQII